MTFKIAFAHGAWRTVEAELCTIEKTFWCSPSSGQPVVIANVLFFEPLTPEPEKTSRTFDRGDLFSGRARV
jgi:hypothetical protein